MRQVGLLASNRLPKETWVRITAGAEISCLIPSDMNFDRTTNHENSTTTRPDIVAGFIDPSLPKISIFYMYTGIPVELQNSPRGEIFTNPAILK